MAIKDPWSTPAIDRAKGEDVDGSAAEGRIAAPQERQTVAHAGLARPQFAHSTEPSAIGGEPSTELG
ncbi:MAG TPA: hypothetical protein VFP83_02855 [Candidatus Limnocylindria bacterium]|nr:hypothetical protein [Candidatus Limnocylindria bacterium]